MVALLDSSAAVHRTLVRQGADGRLLFPDFLICSQTLGPELWHTPTLVPGLNYTMPSTAVPLLRGKDILTKDDSNQHPTLQPRHNAQHAGSPQNPEWWICLGGEHRPSSANSEHRRLPSANHQWEMPRQLLKNQEFWPPCVKAVQAATRVPVTPQGTDHRH